MDRGAGGVRVPARVARTLVLAAVFTCAACGLVYELALVALGSYLVGNSVTQASIVLSVMVFAMGVGSLAAKPLQGRAVVAFAVVEGVLALIGGVSVLALYAAFAWLDLYVPALVVVAFAVGALIGAEIPLLMTLLQRIRKQDAGSAVADLFAADYVGALVGGLAFPFLLLPAFGHIKGALLVGAVNAVAGMAVVLWLFRGQVGRVARAALALGMVAVLAVLGGTYALADRFEVSARQALYSAPIAVSKRTKYQEIVITRQVGLGPSDLRLFLNGDLQFSSVDEYRYHESLVHPLMSGPHGRVLILGGGDGLALREVLRYKDVRSATLVELDPEMLHLARTYKPIVSLNHRSFEDPRVRTVAADAFSWLRGLGEQFDAVVVDMPDPDDVSTAKLYSVEFYGMVKRILAPGGRMVVQSGSPYFAPKSFWSIEKSIAAAGFAVTPYHVDVPSFGDWGFGLAAPGEEAPALKLAADVPDLRFLDGGVLRASTVFPKDRRSRDVEVNTLVHPRLVEYEGEEWKNS